MTLPNAAPLPDPRSHFAAERFASLAGARVLVLGCGSVGGLAAWGLAGAGVGTLVLFDCDRLEPANLRRHVCGPEAIGEPKAEALGRWLHGRFPSLAVETHDGDVLEETDSLRQALESCEAVLAAVDVEGPKHLLDGMARELGRPAVYVGVYGGGWAGEVIYSEARTTGCYACAARSCGRVGIPVFPLEVGPDYALPSAGVPESAWAAADVTVLMPVAALASRLVIARLATDRGDEARWKELRGGEVNVWRLLARAVPGWGDVGSMLTATVPPSEDCPGC